MVAKTGFEGHGTARPPQIKTVVVIGGRAVKFRYGCVLYHGSGEIRGGILAEKALLNVGGGKTEEFGEGTELLLSQDGKVIEASGIRYPSDHGWSSEKVNGGDSTKAYTTFSFDAEGNMTLKWAIRVEDI